jgi:hypothetical protein
VGSFEDKLEHFAATVALEGQRTREAFEAGLSEFVRGQRVTGAIRRPIRSTPGQVYNVGGRLVGWSVRAAGGAVTVDLYDGRDTSGDVLASISLAAGQSDAQTMMPAGITFADGVYADVQGAGQLVGAVWIGAVD